MAIRDKFDKISTPRVCGIESPLGMKFGVWSVSMVLAINGERIPLTCQPIGIAG